MKTIELQGELFKNKSGLVSRDSVIVMSIGFKTDTNKCYGIQYEEIDLLDNELFKKCKNQFDIEETYESFWNRLNGLRHKPHQVVKVLSVFDKDDFKNRHGEIEYKKLLTTNQEIEMIGERD
jgi:hypothetical protein